MKKGFTLTEILIVVSLLGLLFGTLLFSFYRASDSSLRLLSLSDSLKQEALLYWELERKILGARLIHIENDRIYMLTTGGSFYEGVVKCAYFLKDGKLYYYEFPYPYLALDDIEEDKAYEIMRLKSFKVSAIDRNSRFRTFIGIPDFVEVLVNGRRFLYASIK